MTQSNGHESHRDERKQHQEAHAEHQINPLAKLVERLHFHQRGGIVRLALEVGLLVEERGVLKDGRQNK